MIIKAIFPNSEFNIKALYRCLISSRVSIQSLRKYRLNYVAFFRIPPCATDYLRFSINHIINKENQIRECVQ